MLYMTELLLLYALIIRLRDMTRLRYLLEEVLFPLYPKELACKQRRIRRWQQRPDKPKKCPRYSPER